MWGRKYFVILKKNVLLQIGKITLFMRSIGYNLFIILLLVFTMQGCTEKESVGSVLAEPRVYDGVLEIVSEPCVVEPCMPGVVFSLAISEDSSLVVVRDGIFVRWHSNSTAMEKFGVEIGDSLSLNGICEEKKDLNNKKYLTLTVK